MFYGEGMPNPTAATAQFALFPGEGGGKRYGANDFHGGLPEMTRSSGGGFDDSGGAVAVRPDLGHQGGHGLLQLPLRCRAHRPLQCCSRAGPAARRDVWGVLRRRGVRRGLQAGLVRPGARPFPVKFFSDFSVVTSDRR